MLTQLLTPQGSTQIKNKIEVLTGEDSPVGDDENHEDVNEEDELDWYYEQECVI